MPRLQWFKLHLDPDQKSHTIPSLSVKQKDWRQMKYPHHATAASVTTDYIRASIEHVHHVLKMQLGRAYEGMTFAYVITVPAMWSDKAQAELRKCATAAGMGELSDIHIISEPEAAAIHALRANSPNDLQVNDTVLLIDAGGGTVDLITFTIEQLSPVLHLREAAAGTGAYCGSTFLNRRFEDFLRSRFESSPEWDSDTLEQAMSRFEAWAKRRFTGKKLSSSISPFLKLVTMKTSKFTEASSVSLWKKCMEYFFR
jgi:molecular chaperone DnaK (HSP70)